MAKQLKPSEVSEILRRGTFHDLVGALEDEHLECKGAPYHALARAVLGVFVRVLLGFQRHRARLYGPRLFRGCRLELSRAACRERPHVAIPRETDHFHLAVGSRARPFGDAPRAGVLRKNGRDRVRQPQNVARVVANATRRFGRETLAPDGGVERVAELTLEGQGGASGRLFAPERPSANPVLGCSGFDNEVHQAAAPDQCSVFLAKTAREPSANVIKGLPPSA